MPLWSDLPFDVFRTGWSLRIVYFSMVVVGASPPFFDIARGGERRGPGAERRGEGAEVARGRGHAARVRGAGVTQGATQVCGGTF